MVDTKKSSSFKALSAVILIVLTIPSLSWGEMNDNINSPYSFGGACGSQGAWTQNALAATQSLRKITLKLKNDSNCTSLGTSLQAALLNLESNVQSSASDKKSARLSQIPQELSALRNFAADSPQNQKNVLKLMMDTSIEGATLSAQVNQENGSAANRLMDLGGRVSAGTKTGIQLLNQVVDDLPQLNECLIGDGAMALGSFLSSTVKVASAFSSSGEESTGSQLASTISKLTSFARNSKFSKILRKLNQQEFLTSMSCLVELTSESYCQAREGMSLFKTSMKSLKIKKTESNTNTATNPYTGYYVLNTHVPNITKWMQKIQVGVDPKLPTDAEFQNKINQEVTDFFKSVKTLLGDYNSSIITIKTLTTLEQKQNAVLKLLILTSDRMTSEHNSGGGNRQNFFTMAKNEIKIPFFLIGIDTVPDQVAGKQANMQAMPYDQWLMNNFSSIPAFNDPIALAETIRINMNILIKEANIATIEYFNRWYIVDKQALVNESITDVNYTVKDSLKVIQKYLELAKARIVSYKGDASAIPIIVDTQLRIKNVLNAYANIESLGQKWKNFDSVDKISLEEIQASADMYEKLINTVYEQFNVMTSKSGFLANRMVTFVYKDYDLLIKNNVDFTPFQRDLFIAQGMAAFDRMMQLYNGNPANIQSDLNMALRINGGNLDALEMLLKDSMVGTIAGLKLQIERNADSSVNPIPFFNSIRRLLADMDKGFTVHGSRGKYTFDKDMPLIYAPWYWLKHSDRYPLFSSDDTTSSQQSEFSDAVAVRAQLCIQSLAFTDEGPFEDLCRGTVLKNPFNTEVEEVASKNNSLFQELLESVKNQFSNDHRGVVEDGDYSYDKLLLYNTSKQNGAALNHSDRVCAFRNYNHNVMVQYMEINKEKQNHNN